MRTPPRVLVVDDNPSNVRVVRARLAGEGYDVVTAGDGEEALTVARATGPDLILLDVMMPGMDGVTFLQILRQAKKHKEMPVVLVTALDVADVARRTRDIQRGPAPRAFPCASWPGGGSEGR